MCTKYDYLEAMTNDVMEFIKNEVNLQDYDNEDDFIEYLNDTLWTDDSVTGNGSGSYTFNRYKAKEYVVDNMELVAEMADEFGVDNKTLGEKFRDEDWEYFDVSIRCYLLYQAITEAIEKMNITFDNE
jgi:hypothetical protein